MAEFEEQFDKMQNWNNNRAIAEENGLSQFYKFKEIFHKPVIDETLSSVTENPAIIIVEDCLKTDFSMIKDFLGRVDSGSTVYIYSRSAEKNSPEELVKNRFIEKIQEIYNPGKILQTEYNHRVENKYHKYNFDYVCESGVVIEIDSFTAKISKHKWMDSYDEKQYFMNQGI